MAKYNWAVKPYLRQIKEWKMQGDRDSDICKRLKVSRNTFYRYKRNHKELEEALQIGFTEVDATINNTLFKLAMTGDTKAMDLYYKYFSDRMTAYQREQIELKRQELDLLADTKGNEQLRTINIVNNLPKADDTDEKT